MMFGSSSFRHMSVAGCAMSSVCMPAFSRCSDVSAGSAARASFNHQLQHVSDSRRRSRTLGTMKRQPSRECVRGITAIRLESPQRRRAHSSEAANPHFQTCAMPRTCAPCNDPTRPGTGMSSGERYASDSHISYIDLAARSEISALRHQGPEWALLSTGDWAQSIAPSLGPSRPHDTPRHRTTDVPIAHQSPSSSNTPLPSPPLHAPHHLFFPSRSICRGGAGWPVLPSGRPPPLFPAITHRKKLQEQQEFPRWCVLLPPFSEAFGDFWGDAVAHFPVWGLYKYGRGGRRTDRGWGSAASVGAFGRWHLA